MTTEKPAEQAHAESGNAALHRLLAEYIDRLNAGEMLDKDKIAGEHPECASELLKNLEAFRSFGAQPATQPVLGTLGDYTLRRQIGRGGMGVVYEAWENSIGRPVALKVLPAGVAADQRATARFMREAQAAGQLSHENIVRVYSTGVREGTPWYSMEFVEGETLAQILAKIKDAEPEAETPFGKKDHPAYFEKLAECFADVADGLQHAHSKGVTHRDIKPSNLILDPDGRLRILDFGLARLEGQESLTLSGDFVGTPLYMSPEQARRKKIPVDHRTDVYSLGATMYEAICGRPPFRGTDHADTLSQIIERDPIEPRKLNSRVPIEFETIVLKCLRKEAGDRYGTAEALEQDLRRLVRGDPVEARPEARWERLFRSFRRHRAKLAISGTLLVLIVALGWILVRLETVAREARKWERLRYCETAERAALALHRATWALGAHGADGLTVPSRALVFHGDGDLVASMVSTTHVRTTATELRRAVEEFPGEPEAHYYLVKGLLLIGDGSEARAAVERGVSRCPDFPPLRALEERLRGDSRAPPEGDAWPPWTEAWLSAHRAFEEEHWAQAIDAFDELATFLGGTERELYAGSSIEIRLARGVAYLRSGEHRRAQQEFIALTTLLPEALEPRLFLGKAYALEGDGDMASRTFEELRRVAVDPEEAASWISLVYKSMGRLEKALDWARSLPAESVARLRLTATIRLLLWQLEDAVEIADRLLERAPDDLTGLSVGGFGRLWSLTGRAGSKKDAEVLRVVAMAERILAVDPDNVMGHSLLGCALSEQGKLDEAVRACERAVALDSRHPDAIALLGVVLGRKGNYAEAEKKHRQALSIGPPAPSYHLALGYVLVRQGRLDEAIAEYDEAHRLLPSWSWPLENKGWALIGQRKYRDALETFRRALPLPPADVEKIEGLAAALRELGKLEEALRQLDVALSRADDLPGLHLQRALVLEELGRTDDAIASARRGIELAPSSRELKRALDRLPREPPHPREVGAERE